ncbi:serine hydrolase domain-containing protein [Maribacter sp. 2304DJ31-5]|uniref:serine hydrolase domain-containing protein n=1 Tax=Maribacter sp. 2304DJ31-5 TaxID=3386273 RepID=UPI0039BD45BF
MRAFLYILVGFFTVPIFAQEIPSLDIQFQSTSRSAHSLLSEIDVLSVNNYVDSIITNGIKNKAFPGAQILVAEKGNLIFHKAYGFHTYDSVQSVALDDIYDLASVTKIMGPLPALMKLVDEGKLDLDVPFSTYWEPWRKRKDKKDITLREILSHQAGLRPYIVFLDKVLAKNGALKKRFIRKSKNDRFENEAYEGLYVKNTFAKKMYRMINRSKVSKDKKYVYSGLTFLIFPELIRQLTGVPYVKYIQDNFYIPIGSKTLGFLPKTKVFPNKIVPTEVDTIYRHTTTQGWVHDENASLLGGVSGNAGLFGTATDLAKMMQLYLRYGKYGPDQIISENVVREFIQVQYPDNENRRGLGFDKPLLNNSELPLPEAYPAPEVSPQSFGHVGFTGTFVWADPKNQLVYIFLSNRVYPSRNHRKLYELHIRSAVQQVFYTALSKTGQHP